MSPEKRVVLATVLSIVVMVAYVGLVSKTSGSRPLNFSKRSSSASPEGGQTPAQPVPSLLAPTPAEAENLEEPTFWLESQHLRVEVGARSARVKHVDLKGFGTLEPGSLLQFGKGYDPLVIGAPGADKGWDHERHDDRSATWTSGEEPNATSLTLNLVPDQPVLSYSISVGAAEGGTLQLTGSWSPVEGSVSRNVAETYLKTSRKHLHYRQGSSRVVSRPATVVTLAEQFFCESLKFGNAWSAATVRLGRGTHAMTATAELPIKAHDTLQFKVYIGPRDYFWLERADFSDAFPVGFLGTIGLFLMLILKWFASITHSYGLGIIGLSMLVTIGLSPFTLISFRSMKKMQELQPKLDQLRKKHEDDPKRANQEIFSLFKEHRVSPLSGCLPMFLQMPIFFALWSAISHVIELRGQSFLWIKDLSMPDRLFSLPFGFEFNLLPILMAIAMYLQSRITQSSAAQTPTSQNPLAGPVMPIMFGMMFYNVQSCLVLYWLSNSLASISIYRAAKL